MRAAMRASDKPSAMYASSVDFISAANASASVAMSGLRHELPTLQALGGDGLISENGDTSRTSLERKLQNSVQNRSADFS